MRPNSTVNILLLAGLVGAVCNASFATGLGEDISEIRSPKSLEARPPLDTDPQNDPGLLELSKQLGIPPPPKFREGMWFGRALNLIRNAFPVHLNSESRPYGTASSHRVLPKSAFSLVKGKRLTTCLDEACELSGGKSNWILISGQICIVPVRTDGEELTVLDERISFQMQNASTWEALAALFRRVNEIEGRLPILLNIRDINGGALPPSEFGNDDSVSVNSINETVREILCEIFMDSPLGLSYMHSTHTNYESILLFLYKNGLASASTLPMENQMREQEEWQQRLRDFNKDVVNRIRN